MSEPAWLGRGELWPVVIPRHRAIKRGETLSAYHVAGRQRHHARIRRCRGKRADRRLQRKAQTEQLIRAQAANGHGWRPGLITVGWPMCDWPPAVAAQEQAGGGPAGHLAVYCEASPGCRSAWYRPRHEPLQP
jgi:hypothetical protein